jgi:hypothetical protein
MNRRANFSWLLALALVTGCGDDPASPQEVTTEDLAGVWELVGLELRSTDDPPQVIDYIDQGFSGTFTISPDGCYILSFVREGSEPGIQSGMLRVVGSELWVASGECVPGGDFPNTFNFSGDSSYDFDDDGELEPAIQSYTFRRAS